MKQHDIMYAHDAVCLPTGMTHYVDNIGCLACQCNKLGKLHDEIVMRIGPDVSLYADSHSIVMMTNGRVCSMFNTRLTPI